MHRATILLVTLLYDLFDGLAILGEMGGLSTLCLLMNIDFNITGDSWYCRLVSYAKAVYAMKPVL